MTARRWWGSLLAGALLAAGGMAEQQPPVTRPPDPSKSAVISASGPDTTQEARKPFALDLLKSPSGAVFVLYEETKDLLRLLPKLIVLTPEKYQELLDQIELLRRQLKPERPLAPSVCKLNGRIEDDVVRLRAQFEFRTERPRVAVALACRRAWAVSAMMDDGQLPVFQPFGDDGYVIFVDSPGTHQVTLELALPVQTRSSDRLLDLDLPRAAITVLEQLDLPGTSVEARVGGRAIRTKPAGEPPVARLEGIPLGPTERLEIAWKGPSATRTGPTTRTARGRVVARVEEGLVLTEAELSLQVLSGAVAQWRIQVPPAVTLEKVQVLPSAGGVPPEKSAAQDERVEKIERPTDKAPVLTIHLKEPSAEPLRVVLFGRQPRKGPLVPVGPFTAFDVQPQHGTIEVRGRADLRFRATLRGEVVQREVTDEMRAQGILAAFTYWDLASASTPAALIPAPLALELETARGAIEARATHTLQLQSADADRAAAWRVTTRFDFTPARTGVDRLEIELPAGFQYDERRGVEPADIAENPAELRDGPAPRRTLTFRLATRQTSAFHVEFAGTVPVLADRTEATLELPRLTQMLGGAQGTGQPVLDRGGKLQVSLPPALELAARSLPGEASPSRGREPTVWTLDRMPTRIDLAWQPRRNETPNRIVAEIVLAGRWARVRQHFYFPRALEQARVRVPASIPGTVRLPDGSPLRLEGNGAVEPGRWIDLHGPWKDDTLTLTFTVPLPELDAMPQEVPEAVKVSLLQLEGGGETKVFVWADPDVRPGLASAAWEELPLETGPDPERLPDLVVRGSAEVLLTLHLQRTAAAPRLTALVERVLVYVTAADSGPHLYRVRYLLNKLHARHIDIELPVSLGRTGLDLQLDGKEVRRWLVDDAGREAEAGRLVRVAVEPDLYRKPVVLELTYTLGGRNEGNTAWQSHLRPPQLVGAALLGRVRWGVELTPGWLPVYASGANPEHRWAWRGWLPAPRPALTANELERWFAGPDGIPARDDNPDLICWQSIPAPVRVLHVPQQVWLLACSLTFLAIGLGLSFLPLPRSLFWALVAGLGMLVAAVSALWPSTLPLLTYGCEPAALVLLLVVCVQWTLHQRYRRRLIFLPSFTRVKGGSSLIRPTSQPLREPSTVDQLPVRRGSSFSDGAAASGSGI